MRALRIPDRIVIAGVAVALAAAMFNYLRPVAHEQGLREAATSLGWTITSLLALVGSARAWRRASDPLARAGWRWLTLGCAVALVARLAQGTPRLGKWVTVVSAFAGLFLGLAILDAEARRVSRQDTLPAFVERLRRDVAAAVAKI